VKIKALGTGAKLLGQPIADVMLLGSGEKLTWSQETDALHIEPTHAVPNDIALVFKITPRP
jgi:hypothetical protein